ncbi:MAG: prepilin-type N-terminal cleavage/methylation domain-containing protein [Bacilli bacterium]|nr:prepilin-type N-terminal cleavage/methylation domain-containing protein [Bacilli bacterium]
MKKKGFTLIELLAVIVVLAVIAIISVPIITDLINKSRYGAFGVTKKNIEHAAELYYAKNADDVYWEDNIAYVTIGTLKSKKFLRNNVVNTLDSTSINDDTKVLLYRKGRKIDYSLQLYDKQFFDWYQKEMVIASKSEDITLPTTVGDKVTIDLETLMSKGLIDELRLPLELDSRCVGYVEIEKTTDNYEYNAYVDCLQGASTFASHYVSYGGKYLDEFNDVKETSDGGYIAVGRSNSEIITKYGTTNNGKYDAIIVKFKSDGIVEWSRNFGGSNNDVFNAVIEGPDGYVTVGQTSSNDGDLEDYKGGNYDALIVKYDTNGNVVYKKSYGTNSSISNHNERFLDIIIDNNSYIIIGNIDGRSKSGDLLGETETLKQYDGIILKMDLEFNTVWRNFFVGTYNDSFNKIIKTSNNDYIIAGQSNSNDYDMTGIGYEGSYNHEAIILKYDNNGELLKKKSFRGNDSNESFNDVIETTDGYIVVGYAYATDLDMTGLSKANNGYSDAIIVKYDKNLENILWKKSFGGSENEAFNGIKKINNTEALVVGHSKSNDMDMEGLSKSKEGYSNGIILKYNLSNGNVIAKESFGGTNSDIFKSIIKTNENQYVISGSTYSNDINLKNFNKGHKDAIVVKYDNSLNLIKDLQEPVVLIDKLKEIVPNYGTEFQLKYNNIFTTNDPEKDLQGWCITTNPYLEGNTSNYYYPCLEPFNTDDQKLLVEKEVTRGMKVRSGEYEYKVTKSFDNQNSWVLIYIAAGSSSGIMEYSNLKLKFRDGYVGYITDSINKGYIEPLVLVNSMTTTTRPSGLLPSVIDIINENGSTGEGSYPSLRILIKARKSELTSINLTSNKSSSGISDGLGIYELRNFDMSITKTE